MTDLRVENLTHTYPGGRVGLRNVSFSVDAGERMAVVGPNGAGKSTLLLHLNGLLRGNGKVEVGGSLLDSSTVRKVRQQVGLVFQNPDDQLFLPTVLDDVMFGPRNQGCTSAEARGRSIEALRAVGMEACVEEEARHLSLGQRKRVAIATVLAMDVRILVLDEPSAGLDPRGRRSLMALLDAMPQTMVIATHDLDMAATLCSRAAILDGGALVAEGPVRELLADTALMEAHGLECPLSLATR